MGIIHFLDQIDRSLFLFLNGLHTSFLDPIMWEVSKKTIWIPLYIVLIVCMVLNRKKKVWITILTVAIMIVLSDQLADLVKDTVQRFRPTHNPAISGMVYYLKGYQGGLYGFVSSHASNAFAVAAFTALFFARKWFTYLIFFWAILISYSRIYLGVHYPFDVFCGGLLGFTVGVCMYHLEQWGQKKVFGINVD